MLKHHSSTAISGLDSKQQANAKVLVFRRPPPVEDSPHVLFNVSPFRLYEGVYVVETTVRIKMHTVHRIQNSTVIPHSTCAVCITDLSLSLSSFFHPSSAEF